MSFALVTGATGFLGQHLTARLLGEGAHVRILARSAEAARPLVDQGAELVVGEIDDGEAVSRAVAGVQTVFHLAGRLFMPDVAPEVYRTTHVTGTRVLLEACRRERGLQRVVHCSTTGVLGVTHGLAHEEAAYAPTNVYEQTKMEAEQLARAAQCAGLPLAIVRPGLVYGPGDLHLLGLFKAVQRGWFKPIGRRPVWLHPLYVDDLTEAFLRCAYQPAAMGQCFHVAGREPATLAQLAGAIAAALAVPAPRGSFPLLPAKVAALIADCLPQRLRARAPLTRSRLDFLTNSRTYDTTKADRLLGFQAGTDLPTGIGLAADWYRQHGYLPPLARSQA